MLRKLLISAVIVAAAGLAVFWVLTVPATVPAGALAARTPDLANGRTMFYRRRLRLMPRGSQPG